MSIFMDLSSYIIDESDLLRHLLLVMMIQQERQNSYTCSHRGWSGWVTVAGVVTVISSPYHIISGEILTGCSIYSMEL